MLLCPLVCGRSRGVRRTAGSWVHASVTSLPSLLHHISLTFHTPHSFCHVTITHRAEVDANEDLSKLNATSILERRSKPFLTLVALMAILDPPRDEAIEAVKVAHRAGITVKMITGACGCVWVQDCQGCWADWLVGWWLYRMSAHSQRVSPQC
jgi:hypothetical protein